MSDLTISGVVSDDTLASGDTLSAAQSGYTVSTCAENVNVEVGGHTTVDCLSEMSVNTVIVYGLHGQPLILTELHVFDENSDTLYDGCVPNRCENDGSCAETAAGVVCTCQDGFSGSLCEINNADWERGNFRYFLLDDAQIYTDIDCGTDYSFAPLPTDFDVVTLLGADM